MKKKTVLITAFITVIVTMAFIPPDKQQKSITLTVSPSEVETIYKGLGKLPAEESEILRAKIVQQYQMQVRDTTKGGRP